MRRLLEAGAVVTINSDDPTMFGCSLAGDFRELVDRLGPQLVDVEELTLAAAGAAFVTDDRAADIEHTVRSWWSKRR